jgi:hypothetical protein
MAVELLVRFDAPQWWVDEVEMHMSKFDFSIFLHAALADLEEKTNLSFKIIEQREVFSAYELIEEEGYQ